MYTEHFGLKEIPFDVNPDPRYLFPSPDHQEGLTRMMYGVKMRKGLIVLIGEAGTGKTTLLHTLIRHLGEEAVSAWVFNTTLEAEDLLRYVCRDFGVQVRSENRAEMLLDLYQFLIRNFERKRNALLIVDEAQNLSPKTLEEIRLLTNLETSNTKLVQILLVGQPPLEERLRLPELRQFRQRVAVRFRLRPLGREQVAEYVMHRLKVAGAKAPQRLFAPDALAEVYRLSAGVPRIINCICDNALLHAFIMDRTYVDASLIRSLAREGLLAAPEPQVATLQGMEGRRNGTGCRFEAVDVGALGGVNSVRVVDRIA
ncbi:MAG: AAA family ATPase [bacterium]|jgi:general secretion pathway protein A|nr:AAA family ATPase [candidate division KSB1 bacterium]MDH7558847.1 AAA family ATPase [bacterium]